MCACAPTKTHLLDFADKVEIACDTKSNDQSFHWGSQCKFNLSKDLA